MESPARRHQVDHDELWQNLKIAMNAIASLQLAVKQLQECEIDRAKQRNYRRFKKSQ